MMSIQARLEHLLSSERVKQAVQQIKKYLPGPVRSSLLRVRRRLQSHVSEAGEVEILKQLLLPTDLPYLVDIGANDGIFFSNSYEFLAQGWSGLLVEPLPKAFRSLEKRYKQNSKVKCLNVACSNESGAGELFIGADGQMGMTSTLCTDQNDWFQRNRTKKSISVQVQNLTEILKAADVPPKFSLLMIDTEGLDFEVLQGLDFRRYSPRIILTENYALDPEKATKKDEFLVMQGYQLHLRMPGNSFWVRTREQGVDHGCF